jgi:purine nucleosidase
MKRPVLIDTDTASDDAVALIMALRAPELDVKAITLVAGNVGVDQGTLNALYTAELCGSDVPVYGGARKPVLRQLETADWFHGKDGLGDHGYRPQLRTAETESGVNAMIRVISADPGIELITLGPLTNLALALLEAPDLVKNVSRCVVMGGAPCCEGNVTPAAEYNMWVDPEAAEIVFRSGLNIEMVGWQLSRGTAVVTPEESAQILSLGTAFAEFAIRCNSVAEEAFLKQTSERGIALPDPVAMAIFIDPALGLRWSEHTVRIETASELTRGMTVVDRLGVAFEPRNRAMWGNAANGLPARICWELDVAGWKKRLVESLSPAVRTSI